MSRTYRKKYNPLRDLSSNEKIEEVKEYSRYYAQHGIIRMGCVGTQPTGNTNQDVHTFDLIIICVATVTKAHGDLNAMLSIAVKKIDSKVRTRLRQELKRMKAGVRLVGMENVENVNKIRAFERSLCWYDIT
ncbi:hypothetical protein IANJMKHF_00278 [Klebsiella phage CPRSA]|nr:hypothetical protein IANJMKHF_00278 [Klebsiella phage CPRSA]